MSPVKMLVVDDESDVEFLLTRRFRARIQKGAFQFFFARDGRNALELLEHTPDIDIALLDINMPCMDGLELLERLRQNYSHVWPVMVSAYGNLANLKTAFAQGAHDFVIKPIDSRMFELTLERAIHHNVTHKRLEHTLRMSERQYRQLAEKFGDGLAIVRNGKIVFVNQALCELLAEPVDRIIGAAVAERLGESPEAPLMQGNHSHKLAQTHSQSPDPAWQVRHITQQGHDMWVELYEESIEWDEKPARLITVRDVSVHKQYEMQLEESEDRLIEENVTLKSGLNERCRLGDIIGISPPMQAIYVRILQTAATNETVLITGESGTGKELIARTIHQLSGRRANAFVSVNCSAVPENLFESEFFGYCKGAFTDARQDKPGYCDRAHQGTLFLDEVVELSLAAQAKLLHAIELGEYTPLGSKQAKRVDVRVMAATNRDLKQLVREGRIREDFFYRLYSIAITVPPLRERKEDLPLLVEYILKTKNPAARYHPLPEWDFTQIYLYDWPGNVRELINVIGRYMATGELAFPDLHDKQTGMLRSIRGELPESGTLHDTVGAFEKAFLIHMLQQHHWHQANTAKTLGIPARTLRRKIQKHRIVRPKK